MIRSLVKEFAAFVECQQLPVDVAKFSEVADAAPVYVLEDGDLELYLPLGDREIIEKSQIVAWHQDDVVVISMLLKTDDAGLTSLVAPKLGYVPRHTNITILSVGGMLTAQPMIECIGDQSAPKAVGDSIRRFMSLMPDVHPLSQVMVMNATSNPHSINTWKHSTLQAMKHRAMVNLASSKVDNSWYVKSIKPFMNYGIQ